MNFSHFFWAHVCICLFVVHSPTARADRASDAAQLMTKLSQEYQKTILSSLAKPKCTRESISVRQEWHSLSKSHRLDYIRAVRCLQSKPSKNKELPARSRFEDFTLAHAGQTLHIHYSALLLPWHRYFLWLYESALREECGYKGNQPYWDWSQYVADPSASSIFDGSEYSMGGNGQSIPHGVLKVTVPGGPPPGAFLFRKPGTGGGCVRTGPFQNLTLHVDAKNAGATSPIHIFGKKHCLTRDFYFPILQHRNSYKNVTDLILKSPDIQTFRLAVEAQHGIHPGGHEFIGGENMNLFTSPNDPVFYFHHAMVDRVWAIWQSRHPNAREYALDGTLTFLDYPPSPNATIHDVLDVGTLAPTRRIKHFMSTTRGPLCYVYI